jgi:5-guanidino-2-oxopentanoate decarboxylase
MTYRPEPSVGEALIGLLEGYGVEVVFGIPGVHNLGLYRALPHSRIKHILARHEQSAGFMADGYARATGKPGLCFTITGPGLTNILTAMAQAWSDSSPMLVISTSLDIGSSARGRGRLHEMLDQRGAAAAVTNHCFQANTPQDVRDALARSFANFASQRPRPAYLEIPLDVLNQPAGDGWQTRPLPTWARGAPKQIEQAIAKLDAAKRPLIVLGGGALNAGEAALVIAEKLKAPIITTTAGKGAVRADHPLCLGYILGHAGGRELLRNSDAILCAGSELSETDFWDDSFLIKNDLIRIDLDSAVLSFPHTASIAILGDAKETLEVIAKGVRERAGEMRATFAQNEPSALRTFFSNVLRVIRRALPEETIICSDMTQIAYAANEIFPVFEPHTWLHPVGFGTLGFALPAAIGAKCGRGDKPVATIVGDYGLQYTINELATAAELKQPLVILLWNNDALGQIRDDMMNNDIKPNAVTPKNPDFQMLAKAYGIEANKPEHLEDLERAIKVALENDGPTLIEMTPEMR